MIYVCTPWSLYVSLSDRNTDFKEDVIQALSGIPPNFKLTKVTCDQIYTKVSLRSVKQSMV